ncbi:DNA repair protein RadA [candidate division WOR-3 bacterium RBG_13_43_14]|uniref:DNA repair protein RadA n=1 Tax=candidate division WOR-3 bacterium RBG_13_43_14 TaxID=1802590 RepID=A0A1F4U5H4_UNCW3|nr:MAG: DNA repair protein RadA [candidate division WOR-3 bacterium RBG_13_43_14]
MKPSRSKFVCQQCGAIAPKWLGRCPACGEYDSMVEELAVESTSKPVQRLNTQSLTDIPYQKDDRLSVGIKELDRVLGGGLVRGSLILLGGDPGIGKSTLMMQLSGLITDRGSRVLYVSGEESAYQIRVRAERLGIIGEGIQLIAGTELEAILDCAGQQKPDLMIVDSIQAVYSSKLTSAPGSVAQVRECGASLMHFAKDREVTTVLIGHVTKYGLIAGPKTLEHIVDTVLYFEGERTQQYRIIRTIKNRFGSTNEIGVFEMTATGLQEVPNPSSLFISHTEAPGSAVVSIIEGSRPLLVEVQALTSPTYFNYPQRIATGVDHKRLSMLLAVLERRAGISVYAQDCFVNVVGGIKVMETSTDLGIIIAIASSVRDKPIPRDMVVIGEVGLGGEVRPVFGLDSRLKEAENLGFKTAMIARNESSKMTYGLNIIDITEVREAVGHAFNQ